MRPKTATDAGIAELAARQGGVVARGQLIALGVDGSAIKRRVRAGRLHPLHRGVYAVGHRVVGTDGKRWAAVLACGADAALGFASAAAAWEIRRQGGSAIHVVVGCGGRDGRRGIRLHRVRPLAAGELTTLRGLPITTPARTIADLAASGLGERALERAVDQAERTRLLDFADLHALLERYPSRPGSPLLRTVLARYRPRDTRSELEELLHELCTARGLPRPLVNTVVEGKVRDFAWPHARLVVETDSYAWHRSPTALNDDRERDVELTLAGWRTLRFTWRQVTERRRYVAAALLGALRLELAPDRGANPGRG